MPDARPLLPEPSLETSMSLRKSDESLASVIRKIRLWQWVKYEPD